MSLPTTHHTLAIQQLALTEAKINVYTLVFHTGPLPPQNVTVGPITASQISVRWVLPDALYVAGWTFVVRYEDMSSRQERLFGVPNISRASEAGGLQSYTAVIGGLKSYRKYRIVVYTVARHGIESCGSGPLIVQTGEHLQI